MYNLGKLVEFECYEPEEKNKITFVADIIKVTKSNIDGTVCEMSFINSTKEEGYTRFLIKQECSLLMKSISVCLMQGNKPFINKIFVPLNRSSIQQILKSKDTDSIII